MVSGQTKNYALFIDRIASTKKFQDSLHLVTGSAEIISDWWQDGYFFAGIDSITAQGMYLHQGEKVRSMDVKLSYYDAYTDSLIESATTDDKSLWLAIETQLEDFRNTGYPFAQARINRLSVSDGWHGEVVINPGPFIQYDSVILVQDIDLGKSYLYNTLKIKPGEDFSERAIEKIPDRLERLPFLELQTDPEVTFVDGGAQVYLDMKESKQSSFEGVIGFLPGQSGNNSLVVTGYLDLNLANLFKSGKALHFSWNRFADQSQSTQVNYSHPYFLASPLFINVDFNLLKQDTSFLNQNWQLESGTYLWKSSELFFGLGAFNGNLIQPDGLDLENGIADYRSRSYHIGIRSSYAQLPFSFGQYFKFALKAAIGEKRINRNPAVPESAYDTLKLKTQQLSFSGLSRAQVVVKDRLTLYHEINGQLLFNDQLLINELARVGGLRSLRGFNENFFYARDFLLSKVELRQFFEKKSFMMLFYDVMYFRGITSTQVAQGFGLGINLNTSNGLFTFATAVGTAKDISLDFTNIKVHIGYSSRF